MRVCVMCLGEIKNTHSGKKDDGDLNESVVGDNKQPVLLSMDMILHEKILYRNHQNMPTMG